MEFFVFKFLNPDKVLFDRVINILGMIIIPLVVWFLSSVRAEFVKKRETGIQILNSLILCSNNFFKQIVSFSEIMDKKFYALENYIISPTAENFNNTFTIIQAPTLLYALNYEP